MTTETTERKRGRQGFASMERGKHLEIASLGGRTAHERGTAHQFTSEEAKAAGRKGGLAVARDREHMKRIGKLGGRKVKEAAD